MTRLGCCGGPRPSTSLAGLVAQADAFPSSSPQGRHARMKLAYTIVAGRAAQTGNHAAYEIAMRNLQGLGDGPTLTTHGTATTIINPEIAAAQAAPITATLQGIFNQAAPAASSTFRQVQSVIGILTGVARLGTGIASAVPGADQNAIRTINMILSWIGTLMNGTAPTIPTLDPATVQGLVSFCAFKDAIRGLIGAALGVASGVISAAGASSGNVDASALAALETIRVWTDGIINGICNIPQVSAAVAAQNASVTAADLAARDAACKATSPMSSYSQAAGKCVCPAGYRDGGSAAEGCYPVAAAPSGAPVLMLTREQVASLRSPTGSLTPAQQALVTRLIQTNASLYEAPKASSSGVLVPAAIGVAALFYLLK